MIILDLSIIIKELLTNENRGRCRGESCIRPTEGTRIALQNTKTSEGEDYMKEILIAEDDRAFGPVLKRS